MKKSVLVILALVITLTMVMASASTVSAAPPVKAWVDIYGFGGTTVTYDPGWKHLGVDYFETYVYRAPDEGGAAGNWTEIFGPGTWLGEDGIVLRNRSSTGGACSQTDPDIWSGYWYKVVIHVYDKRGNDIYGGIEDVEFWPYTS